MIDAFDEEGIKGGVKTLPALFGVGFLTYRNEVKKIKDKIAKDQYKMSWDEVGFKLGEKAQYELGKNSPELQAAMEKEDEAMLGTSWGRWREEGKQIETGFQDSINKYAEEYRLTGDGVVFKDKVNDAALVRREMYEARKQRDDYKEILDSMEKEMTEDERAKKNPLDLAKYEYYKIMYSNYLVDEFGNYDFDEAERRKEEFKSKYGDKALKYVEEYMGTRYDIPSEYKELQDARKVLQPYWNIIDKVKSMGVNPESRFGQRVVQRLRDQMKLQNPLIAKYLKKFYYGE
jgi:hypothetical protein